MWYSSIITADLLLSHTQPGHQHTTSKHINSWLCPSQSTGRRSASHPYPPAAPETKTTTFDLKTVAWSRLLRNSHNRSLSHRHQYRPSSAGQPAAAQHHHTTSRPTTLCACIQLSSGTAARYRSGVEPKSSRIVRESSTKAHPFGESHGASLDTGAW